MKVAHCLRIVFVIEKHTNIFREDFSHGETLSWGGMFSGVSFQGKTLHWGDLPEFLSEISPICLTFSLPIEDCIWRRSGGVVRRRFSAGLELPRGFFLGGYFPRGKLSIGKLFTGATINRGGDIFTKFF